MTQGSSPRPRVTALSFLLRIYLPEAFCALDDVGGILCHTGNRAGGYNPPCPTPVWNGYERVSKSVNITGLKSR